MRSKILSFYKKQWLHILTAQGIDFGNITLVDIEKYQKER